MKRYKVFHSARFDRDLSKLDLNFQKQVGKMEDKLVQNPYAGKPLNVGWFREKKIDKYRIYYLIYDDLKIVFMVAISEKKDQQKTINTIRLLFNNFRSEIERLADDYL